MKMNLSSTKVITIILVIAFLFALLPGNVSGQPLDLSGIGKVGNKIGRFVKDVGETISNFHIHFDTGDNKNDPPPIDTNKSIKVTAEVTPDKDNEVKSASGSITLKIPQGAVSQNTEIEITEYPNKPSTGLVMLNYFEMNAKQTGTGKAVTIFNTNLEITINHTPPELAGVDTDTIRLYYLDESTGLWVPVSNNKYDSKSGTLVNTTNHFSIYSEQANPLQVGPGRVLNTQVNLHTGAATYSYPITLPAGPGGFTPKLGLTYNSSSVDEMKNQKSVGSWVGIGWDLKLGSISYDEYTKTYYMDLNGSSFTLVHNDDTHFQTNPDEYFKITRNSANGDTWTVLDKDGNSYQFGGTSDSKQYIVDSSGTTYYRYDLSSFHDTNNNEADVTYTQTICTDANNYNFVRSAYPATLTWAGGYYEVVFNSSYDVTDQTDGQVRYDNPLTYGNNPAPKVMENRRLNSIEIKANSTLIQKYSFAYNTDSSKDKVFSANYGGIYYSGYIKLLSITQIGSDGTSSLPATTFEYEDLAIYTFTPPPIGPTQYIKWPHLSTVHSGYGGSTSFTYSVPAFNYDTFVRQVVTEKTVSSGIGSDQTYDYTYANGGNFAPSYTNVNNTDLQYRGFNQVRETDSAGNYVVHWFYTTGTINGENANKLTGKEYKTEWYDSSDNLLKETTYDWGLVNTNNVRNCFLNYWNLGGAWYKPSIDVSSQGRVFLLSFVNPNSYYPVAEYDTAGTLVDEWGMGQFNNASYRLAVKDANHIYVIDNGDYTVKKFTLSGTLTQTISHSFSNPMGLNFDASGNLYVADTYNNRIQKFLSDDTYSTMFGTQGSGNGQFNYPSDVAFDSSGNIYVADSGNNRLQKFNSSGTYQTQWGSNGSGDSQFSGPSAIDIDSNGYLYIVDYNNSRIQVLDTSGTFVTRFSMSTPYGGPKDVAVYGDSLFVSVAKDVAEYAYNWASQLNEVTETTYEVGNEEVNRTTDTEYVYDDYGNIITEKINGDTDTTSDDLTIWRVYYQNTTANILDKPARERVYATIMTSDSGGANLKKETKYYYDNGADQDHDDTDWEVPPELGMVTRVESSIDSSTSVSVYYAYDSFGNTTSVTDANGNVTETEFEDTYNIYPATRVYPITSLTESYVYVRNWTEGSDTGVMKITATDVNGIDTISYYDKFNRLSKVVKVDDSYSSPSVEYQYNSWGTLNSQCVKTITKIDASNQTWQADYFDGLGRVVQSQAQGESGHTIISGTTTYNNCGQVDKQYVSQDIASNLTAYYNTGIGSWKYSETTYEALGRIASQTSADGSTTSNDYTNPWQTNVTNPLGKITKQYNDAFGRLTKVEEPDEDNDVYATTEYTYDTLGNLSTVTDDASNTTTMTYDWLARKLTMSDPDMGNWSYGYDAAGNLTSQTDALNQTIEMVYDDMNRLTNKNYPVGSGMTNIVYTYDTQVSGDNGDGKRTIMTDAAGTTTDKYDTRGRLIEEKKTIASVDYTTSYTYDGLDRVVTVTYPNPDQPAQRETVTNSYNGRGLPSTVSGSTAGSLVTSTLYNQLGAVTEINLNSGVKITYGYYGVGGTYDTSGGYYGQLWEIKSAKQSPATTLQDTTYSWDANGNMSIRTDAITSQTETFTYDSLDRLTGVSGAYSKSYTYNTIGNITNMNGNSYTYDSNHKHAVASVGATSYAYDANGNMTTRGSQTLTWDVENRVTSVTGGASFYYDGDGNRFKKTENSQTTLYINQFYEKNISTGVVTTYYYLGGKLVANRTGSTLKYVNQDSLNSTSTITDSTGVLTGAIKYFPFGETRSDSVNGIVKATLTNAGTGYTSTPTVSISGTGTGATVQANISLASISVTSAGSNYTAVPTATLTGGGGTGATASVTLSAGNVTGITITNGGSGYTSAPTISLSGGGGSGATATATIGGGSVSALTVTNGGSGYTSAPTVTISGVGTGATATATVSGEVSSVAVNNSGSGYSSAPSVSFSGGGGSGAAATASLTGAVASVVITYNGAYGMGSGIYTNGTPTVTFSGGGGSGATAQAYLNGNYQVDHVTITNGGSGYTSAPTVTFSNGSYGYPPCATGYATIGNVVNSISVTNGGSGYTSAPTVGFSGGGGSGATATATTQSVVSSLTVTAGGNGYSSTPTVSFSGGGGSGAAATATTVGVNSVSGVTINNRGTSYTSAPSVSFSGGGGSGAAATAAITQAVNTITVNNGGSGYTSSPTVSFSGGGGGSGATATATISGAVASIGVNYQSSGYTVLPTVTLVGGGGSGATVSVSGGPGGSVGITLTSGGSGYSSAPSVVLTGGDGTPGSYYSTISCAVSSVTVTNGGLGYTSAPTVSFSGGGGSSATATANMTGVINTITVTNGGSSYTSDPTVGFSGGGGSGASATSVRPTALVVSITVNNQGSGYTEEPAVSFSGGGGSGAAATSTVGNRTVTGVTLTNAGTGYTDAPTVSFSGGGSGSGAVAQVVISLTGISVTNAGSGYSNPTVSITGGGGSGATATATVGVVDTDRLFTGQRLDSTGLYYYNARYYDPAIGRFISSDTMGQELTDPQSLNRYTYCSNNPLKYTDPDGHFAFLAAMAIGGLIGGLVSTGIYAVMHQNDFDWKAAGAAFVGGAITGAVAVIAGPIGGTVAMNLGASASGAVASVGTAFVNGVAGVGANIAENAIMSAGTGSFHMDAGEMVVSGISNAASGLVSSALFPTTGMDTLKQGNIFTPKIKGFVNAGPNARAVMQGAVAGTIFDAIVEPGISQITSTQMPIKSNNNIRVPKVGHEITDY